VTLRRRIKTHIIRYHTRNRMQTPQIKSARMSQSVIRSLLMARWVLACAVKLAAPVARVVSKIGKGEAVLGWGAVPIFHGNQQKCCTAESIGGNPLIKIVPVIYSILWMWIVRKCKRYGRGGTAPVLVRCFWGLRHECCWRYQSRLSLWWVECKVRALLCYNIN
jgi:hypothetical protein